MSPKIPSPSQASLSSSLVDKVALSLSQQITTGQYKDCELLPTEPQLIQLFGVSRTVIREAIRNLLSRGLVEVDRGRGVRIVKHLHLPLSHSLELSVPDVGERLKQLLEVRRVVEPAVARLAALRASAAYITRMRVAQAELARVQVAEEAVQLDLKFHRLLVQSVGNSVFSLMLESVAELGQASRLATITTVGWLRAHEHHDRILNAVEARQPDAAERAMLEHLDWAGVDLQQHLGERS